MTTPPILLLHGALGSSAQMAPLASALESEGHTVHTLDFEGHGTAPPTDGPFTIERFAANIVAYLDENDIERADIFGYSMGGYAALQAATIAPARIGSVATLGTKFAWTPEAAAHEVSRLNPEVIEAKVPRFAAILAERHGAERWGDLVRETAALLTELGEHPVVMPETLAGIDHRVRICVGDRDEMVTLGESVDTYRALPNGELSVLPNTPHPIERALIETILTALMGFYAVD